MERDEGRRNGSPLDFQIRVLSLRDFNSVIIPKVLTRWVNTILKERELKIHDLTRDFSDGVNLIALLEILSSETVPNYSLHPKIRVHKIHNCYSAFSFMKKSGINITVGTEMESNLFLTSFVFIFQISSMEISR
jgi:hypothetical protein